VFLRYQTHFKEISSFEFNSARFKTVPNVCNMIKEMSRNTSVSWSMIVLHLSTGLQLRPHTLQRRSVSAFLEMEIRSCHLH
jgi:hypothetical protein